jgi:hypothetical protein
MVQIDSLLLTVILSGALLLLLVIVFMGMIFLPNYKVVLAILVFLIIIGGFLTLFFIIKPANIVDTSGGLFDIPTATNEPTTYYSYNPKSKTLTKINLQKTIGNSGLSDYFHRNDESIFVSKDGTVTSILGSISRQYKSLPNVKKIRILNNQYVGLADGKIYTSKDLQNWTLDRTKPANILDIDVPANQIHMLHMRTPTQNLTLDTTQNKIISSSKSENKKYGSDLNNFIRFGDSGVHIHDKYFQPGYKFAEIDHYNRVYFVPESINGYNVKDVYTSDQLALVGLNIVNGPDTINVGDKIKYHN